MCPDMILRKGRICDHAEEEIQILYGVLFKEFFFEKWSKMSNIKILGSVFFGANIIVHNLRISIILTRKL